MLVEQEKRYHTVCEMFASWLSPTKILKLERHKFLVFSVIWLPYNLLSWHQWPRSVYSILQIILRCFNTCILWPDLDSLGKHWKESEQYIKPGFTEAMKCPVNNYGEVIAYLLLRLHLISLLKMMEELQQEDQEIKTLDRCWQYCNDRYLPWPLPPPFLPQYFSKEKNRITIHTNKYPERNE